MRSVRRPSVSRRVPPTRNHPCARLGCNAVRAAVRVGLEAPALVVRVVVGLAVLCPEVLALVVRAGPANSAMVVPATIGDRLGIRRTPIGADGSMGPRGETTCRHGAGARHLALRGTGRCRHRGARPRRRSTTSATCSNPCGIPGTTNGASGSSGCGYRCPSDELDFPAQRHTAVAWCPRSAISSSRSVRNMTPIKLSRYTRTVVALSPPALPARERCKCDSRDIIGIRTRDGIATRSGRNEVKAPKSCQDA